MSRIELVVLKNGTKGDYYQINSEGNLYNCFPDLDKKNVPQNVAFNKIEQNLFKAGDDVVLTFKTNEGKDRNGKPIVFRNLVNIDKIVKAVVSVPKPAPSSANVPTVSSKEQPGSEEWIARPATDWDAKERAIIMENALSQANKWAETNRDEIIKKMPVGNKVITPEAIIEVAKDFYKAIVAKRKEAFK